MSQPARLAPVTGQLRLVDGQESLAGQSVNQGGTTKPSSLYGRWLFLFAEHIERADIMRNQILALLRENSRYTSGQIAAMLNLPEAEVAAEIAALEQEKVIRQYTVLVDPEKAGGDTVTALIEVKVHPQREHGFDRIAERIYMFPEVRSCWLMSGTYDLAVLVEGRDLKEVARFVAQKLAALESVRETTTHFILKHYKQDGVVFAEGDEDQRLAVTP